MIYNDSTTRHPSVCQLVPGYAFYSGMGYGLAESLVNCFEVVARAAKAILSWLKVASRFHTTVAVLGHETEVPN